MRNSQIETLKKIPVYFNEQKYPKINKAFSNNWRYCSRELACKECKDRGMIHETFKLQCSKGFNMQFEIGNILKETLMTRGEVRKLIYTKTNNVRQILIRILRYKEYVNQFQRNTILKKINQYMEKVQKDVFDELKTNK